MHDKFYVYTHHRATDGSVFYVGKGHGIRAYTKSSRNPHWHNVVKKNGYTIKIVKEFDDENCCLTFEKILIAFYGIGNLTNQSTGGMPAAGTKRTEEQKEKMRGRYTGEKNPNFGKIMSQEQRDKISKTLTGRPSANLGKKLKRSEELKIAQILRMKKVHKMLTDRDPEYWFKRNNGPLRELKFKPVQTKCGIKFDAMVFAEQWLKQNGWPKARGSRVGDCCNGKRQKAYGYEWEYQK